VYNLQVVQPHKDLPACRPCKMRVQVILYCLWSNFDSRHFIFTICWWMILKLFVLWIRLIYRQKSSLLILEPLTECLVGGKMTKPTQLWAGPLLTVFIDFRGSGIDYGPHSADINGLTCKTCLRLWFVYFQLACPQNGPSLKQKCNTIYLNTMNLSIGFNFQNCVK